MKTYVIRVNTINNLYADYIIEANNLFEANEKCKKAFFRDYEGADKNIKLSLVPNTKNLKEIIDIIKESC